MNGNRKNIMDMIVKENFFEKKMFRVITALVTLLCFLVTTGLGDVFVHTAWAAKAPLVQTVPTGIEDPLFVSELNIETFVLPQNLGTIEDTWSPSTERKIKNKRRKTIIHIQDAHCNYDAQHKIARIIDHLGMKYGIDVVNLEGGESDYDLSLFTEIEDTGLREKVADYFVKEGIVSGAEYFAINNPGKADLWGVEDTDLYLQNLNVYHDFSRHKREADRYLRELDYFLGNLKRHIYSDELLQLDRKYSQYKAGGVEFKDYLTSLIEKARLQKINIRKHVNVLLLSQILEREKEVDFKRANVERDMVIDRLQKVLSKKELRELVTRTVEFRKEIISQYDFYEYLVQKAKEAGMATEDFSELSKYMIYISLYNIIDKSRVMEEIDALESEIKEVLYQNDKQKELDQLSKNLILMKNIFNVTLTRDDYEYYRENETAFGAQNYIAFINKEAPLFRITVNLDSSIHDLDLYRKKMTGFYEWSFKRDKAFIKNIKFSTIKSRATRNEQRATILMTGGFHAENLHKLFREHNISYVSIIPRFENEDGYECPYFTLLSGGWKNMVKGLLSKTSLIAIYSHFCQRSGQVNGADSEEVIALWKEFVEARFRGDGTFQKKTGNRIYAFNKSEEEGFSPVFEIQGWTVCVKDQDTVDEGDDGINWLIAHIEDLEREYIDVLELIETGMPDDAQTYLDDLEKRRDRIFKQIDLYLNELEEDSPVFKAFQAHKEYLGSVNADLTDIYTVYYDLIWTDRYPGWDGRSDEEGSKMKFTADGQYEEIHNRAQEVWDKWKTGGTDNLRDMTRIIRIRDKLAPLKEELDKTENELEQITSKLDEFEKRQETLEGELSELQEKQEKGEDLTDEIENTRKKINELETAFKIYTESRQDLQMALADAWNRWDESEESLRRLLRDLVAYLSNNMGGSFARQLYWDAFKAAGPEKETVVLEAFRHSDELQGSEGEWKEEAAGNLLKEMEKRESMHIPEYTFRKGGKENYWGIWAEFDAVSVLEEDKAAQGMIEEVIEADCKELEKKIRTKRKLKKGIPKRKREWSRWEKIVVCLLVAMLVTSVVFTVFLVFYKLFHQGEAPSISGPEEEDQGVTPAPEEETVVTEGMGIAQFDLESIIGSGIKVGEPMGEKVEGEVDVLTERLREKIRKVSELRMELQQDMEKFEQEIREQEQKIRESASSPELKEHLGKISEQAESRKRVLTKEAYEKHKKRVETDPSSFKGIKHKEDKTDPEPAVKPGEKEEEVSVKDDYLEKEVGHGGGNDTVGDWVADCKDEKGIPVSSYLCEGGFAVINPITGKVSVSEPEWKAWPLEQDSEASEWVVMASDGRDKMLARIPPAKAIVNVQAGVESKCQEVSAYYDKANGKWYLKFDKDPERIRIGIRDANSSELGDIPLIQIDRSVEDTWKDSLPEPVRDILEKAKDLSLEEREKVKSQILSWFYYSTNPCLARFSRDEPDFIKFAFKYFSMACDGLARLDAILSHELGIPARVHAGFMDRNSDGSFYSGGRHTFVLTQEGDEIIVEEATALVGESSPLYGREATPEDYKKEEEYIKQRAEHILQQLDKPGELMEIRLEKEKLRGKLSETEARLKEAEKKLEEAEKGMPEKQDERIIYEQLREHYNARLRALRIPSLSQDGDLPYARELLDECQKFVFSEKTLENKYQLMAVGHFMLEMLSQIGGVFPDLEQEVSKAKAVVYEKMSDFAFEQQWLLLREPLKGEPLGSKTPNAIKRNFVIEREEDETYHVGDSIHMISYQIRVNGDIFSIEHGPRFYSFNRKSGVVIVHDQSTPGGPNRHHPGEERYNGWAHLILHTLDFAVVRTRGAENGEAITRIKDRFKRELSLYTGFEFKQSYEVIDRERKVPEGATRYVIGMNDSEYSVEVADVFVTFNRTTGKILIRDTAKGEPTVKRPYDPYDANAYDDFVGFMRQSFVNAARIAEGTEQEEGVEYIRGLFRSEISFFTNDRMRILMILPNIRMALEGARDEIETAVILANIHLLHSRMYRGQDGELSIKNREGARYLLEEFNAAFGHLMSQDFTKNALSRASTKEELIAIYRRTFDMVFSVYMTGGVWYIKAMDDSDAPTLTIDQLDKAFEVLTEKRQAEERDPAIPEDDQEDTGTIRVVDVLTGESITIPANGEVVDYYQGAFITGEKGADKPSGISISGKDKTLKYQAQVKELNEFFVLPNGDWLAVSGVGDMLSFMGPLAERSGLFKDGWLKAIPPAPFFRQKGMNRSVTIRADGSWISAIEFGVNSPAVSKSQKLTMQKCYLGTFNGEQVLMKIPYAHRILPPLFIDDTWVGAADIGSPKLSLVGPGAQKMAGLVQDRIIVDWANLPDGDYVVLAKNDDDTYSFVGPGAAPFNNNRSLTGPKIITPKDRPPLGIEAVYGQRLIKVRFSNTATSYFKKSQLRYDHAFFGPAAEEAGIAGLEFMDSWEPVFAPDGRWIGKIVNWDERGAAWGYVGSLFPENSDLRYSYGTGYGIPHEDYIFTEDGDLRICLWDDTRKQDVWVDSLQPNGRKVIIEYRKKIEREKLGLGVSRQHYLSRIAGLYNIPSQKAAGQLRKLRAERLDIRWRNVNALAKVDQGAALRELGEILDYMDQHFPEVYASQGQIVNFFDLQTVTDTIKPLLHALPEHLSENQMITLMKFLRTTEFKEYIIELFDHYVDPNYTIRGAARAKKVTQGCSFTLEQWREIVSDYLQKFTPEWGFDPLEFPLFVPADFHNNYHDKAKDLNTFMLGVYEKTYPEHDFKSYKDCIDRLDLIGENLNITLGSTLEDAFAGLRELTGMGDRHFDIEIESSVRDNPVYKAIQLVRRNPSFLKLKQDSQPWDKAWWTETDNVGMWDEINQGLMDILKDDYQGKVTLDSVWKEFWDECSHDAICVLFMIGVLAFLLSYASDTLRKRDMILGPSADRIIERILKESPWFTGRRADTARQLLNEMMEMRSQGLTRRQQADLETMRMILPDNQRAVFDAISCVAMEPPAKTRGALRRMISLVPLAALYSVLDTRDHHGRQAMNRELLKLFKSIDEKTDPDEVYEGIREIVDKYSVLSSAGLESDREQIEVEFSQIEERLRKELRSKMLLRVGAPVKHSLKPNGRSKARAGQGSEFLQLREYVPGQDDYRKIDWNATARRGKTMVRETETDTTKRGSILVDMRSVFDKNYRDTWVKDTARSLVEMFDPVRLQGKQPYTLDKFIFIMPGNIVEIERQGRKVRYDIKGKGLDNVILMLQKRYKKSRETLAFNDLDFYNREQNRRYAERTGRIFGNGTKVEEKLGRHVKGWELEDEHVFCVGIRDNEDRREMTRVLGKRSVTPLFWDKNEARPFSRLARKRAAGSMVGTSQSGSFIGKVTDKEGNVIGGDVRITRGKGQNKKDEEGEGIFITSKRDDEFEPVFVPFAKKKDSAEVLTLSPEEVRESIKAWVKGRMRGLSSEASEAVSKSIAGIIDGLQYEVEEIIVLEDHEKIKGVVSEDEKVLYLNRHLLEPLGFIHELGEAFVKLPWDQEYIALTRHTFMRGAGKDVRRACNELIEEEGKEKVESMSPDKLIEKLDEKMRKPDFEMSKERNTRVQKGESPVTESEIALIRYNASLKTASPELKGEKLLYGIQDHLDPAGNAVFTKEISLITDDLRQGDLNVFVIPRASRPGAEKEQFAVGQDLKRKFDKSYGISTGILYYDPDLGKEVSSEAQFEEFTEQLGKAYQIVVEERNKAEREEGRKALPKIYVDCPTQAHVEEARSFIGSKRTEDPEVENMICIGNDPLKEGRIIDEARVVAVGTILMNDRRVQDIFDKMDPQNPEFMRKRREMLAFFQSAGIIDDAVDFMNMSAVDLGNFVRKIWTGDKTLRITPINWETLRQWKDSQNQVLQSL